MLKQGKFKETHRFEAISSHLTQNVTGTNILSREFFLSTFLVQHIQHYLHGGIVTVHNLNCDHSIKDSLFFGLHNNLWGGHSFFKCCYEAYTSPFLLQCNIARQYLLTRLFICCVWLIFTNHASTTLCSVRQRRYWHNQNSSTLFTDVFMDCKVPYTGTNMKKINAAFLGNHEMSVYTSLAL